MHPLPRCNIPLIKTATNVFQLFHFWFQNKDNTHFLDIFAVAIFFLTLETLDKQ